MTWYKGDAVPVSVRIDANHGGSWQFQLARSPGEATDAVFTANLLADATQTTTFPSANGVRLPPIPRFRGLTPRSAFRPQLTTQTVNVPDVTCTVRLDSRTCARHMDRTCVCPSVRCAELRLPLVCPSLCSCIGVEVMRRRRGVPGRGRRKARARSTTAAVTFPFCRVSVRPPELLSSALTPPRDVKTALV